MTKCSVPQSSREKVKDHVVDVYKTDGQFVHSFGKNMNDPCDITAANDGRVMVVERNSSCTHIFNEHVLKPKVIF